MQSYVQRGEWNCSVDHRHQGAYSYCAEAKTWRSTDTTCTHYHMVHMDNKVYQGISANKHPPSESTKLIRHTLITTLRDQYERIDGADDASELMRMTFRKRWCTTSMATTMEWIYGGSM